MTSTGTFPTLLVGLIIEVAMYVTTVGMKVHRHNPNLDLVIDTPLPVQEGCG
jgi:hypothetical protein